MTTGEKDILAGNVLAANPTVADFDPDNDEIFVSAVEGNDTLVGGAVTLESGALVTVNAGGTFSNDPNDKFDFLNVGETATDTFTYTIADGAGNFSTATATVTVTGAPPVGTAGDDFLIGSELGPDLRLPRRQRHPRRSRRRRHAFRRRRRRRDCRRRRQRRHRRRQRY